MKELKISKDLKLPLDIVTQTVAILAKRRVGKSYTMRGIAEQLLDCGQQVVLVDPKGDQWGIRSSADGKKPGYPVVILGGEHGDAPLEVNGGEIVAKLVVEERVSVLLDLSMFRKHEIATFMAIFLENLYRLKAQEKYRTPVMLIVDEADAIAPQKPQKGEERMLGAIEDIVRRGGQRGIGCIVVTQRSAVLNKNVLTQAQMLIVLRTIAPQDLAAMNAWIDVHGTTEQRKILMESLPALPIGDAWFWSPGWPTAEGVFKLVHVLPIKTFDSAATPKPGEKKITPKNLADVDMDSLKKQMAATIEKAKNEDPKLLKKKIMELERDLTIEKKKSVVVLKDPKTIEKEIEKAVNAALIANDRKWQKEKEAMEKYIAQLLLAITEMCTYGQKALEIKRISVEGSAHFEVPKQVYNAPLVSPSQEKRQHAPLPVERTQFDSVATHTSEEKQVGKGEMIVLSAVAQFWPEGTSNEHIAVLTGYKATSRKKYLQILQAKGYVRKENGVVFATEEGRDILGSEYKPLPTGQDLQVHLLKTLPQGEAKILDLLLAAYPNELSNEEIEEKTNYKPTSRKKYLQALTARKLVERKNGSVRVSDKLF